MYLDILRLRVLPRVDGDLPLTSHDEVGYRQRDRLLHEVAFGRVRRLAAVRQMLYARVLRKRECASSLGKRSGWGEAGEGEEGNSGLLEASVW